MLGEAPQQRTTTSLPLLDARYSSIAVWPLQYNSQRIWEIERGLLLETIRIKFELCNIIQDVIGQ